ncbi:hypothetical protein [Streptomyces olivaceoviridis]|uniref:hypothetical protein n=1 Tax=Streptomyces olivaceoviridis TaxID=1921 RepID=UPI00332BA5FA
MRRLSQARKAPRDLVLRARMVELSWSGQRVPAIADEAHECGPSEWTLDTLTVEARRLGIDIGRSQVRRILLAEGVRWRRTRSWIRSKDPDFEGKGRGSSSSIPARPKARRSSAPTSSDR